MFALIIGAVRTRTAQAVTVLVLTALAGFVDALGFVRLGGLYTSFMSGNTTQLSVFLGHADFAHVVLPAILIGGFLGGAILGSGLSILIPSPWATPAVLGYEALLILAALGVGLAIPELGIAAFFMAVAMGSGAQVTKGVADVVLLKDQFARLPEAVGEGRRIARNIHRLGRLYLTKTVYAATLILLVAVLTTKLVLNPRYFTLPALAAVIVVAIRLDGAPWRLRLLALAALVVSGLLLASVGNAHPRWEMVFQPKYAAYINLIEQWWKVLRSLALAGRRFETWDEVADAIAQATDYWNAHRHPFRWGQRRRHRPRRQPGIALLPKAA